MQSSNYYFRKLTIIFWSILLLQVIFLNIVIWIIEPDREDDFDLHFIISNIIVMIGGFSAAYFIPYRKIKSAKQKLGLREKMLEYKKAIFIRWFSIVIVSLYSIIAFIMTREYIFICTTLFTLTAFLFTRPSVQIACEHLDLSRKEQNILYNPDSAI